MNIVLSGYGQIGRLLETTITKQDSMNVVGIVDSFGQKGVTSFADLDIKADVIIDFSHPNQLTELLDYATKNDVPLVIGTTNFSDTDIQQIKDASSSIAIVHTSNTSLGVQALLRAVTLLQQQLPSADIEIIETHHRYKQDAPSGTAKMIVEALEDGELVYGREGVSPRTKGEIGIHSVRGGTVAGIHEVQFLMDDEVVTITHKADSKQVFVNGALSCASYVVNQPAGYYRMEDVTKGV